MAKLDKVLITGSSKGLGKSLATYFFEKGHEVILHGRDELALKNIKTKISEADSIDYYACDLNSEKDVVNLSKYANSKNVNLLINNAGIHCANKDFIDLDISYINNIINVNLRAPILLSYGMLKTLNGIININSMSGIETKKFRTLYAATKWGLKGFSNCLKHELENKTILDVYPTNIKTNKQIVYGMEIDIVTKSIYKSYYNNESELILDGRKKNE
jgi:short-subunit dehydrogenase